MVLYTHYGPVRYITVIATVMSMLTQSLREKATDI